MHKTIFLLFILPVFTGSPEKSCAISSTLPASSRQQCQIPFGISSYNDKSKDYPEERKKFNFASLDCGARILAANEGAREITSILVNAKDKYMVNQCSTKDKFIELEFCQEILVESVVFANYELFSGVFKDIKIYVNHVYPASFKHTWKLIGDLTALNIKGKQVSSTWILN